MLNKFMTALCSLLFIGTLSQAQDAASYRFDTHTYQELRTPKAPETRAKRGVADSNIANRTKLASFGSSHENRYSGSGIIPKHHIKSRAKAVQNRKNLLAARVEASESGKPPVRAKALFCVDCSNNNILLAKNVSEPMPIASITKLLTAMVVVDQMNLDQLVQIPEDIIEVEKHKVGIKPGELFTVRDLLHGMLIESGNDCAEALARAYPKGGRDGFIAAMNRRAAEIGAHKTLIFTPSGLDLKITIGKKDGKSLETRRPNMASAEDVAIIARNAFAVPLISEISSMRTYTMQTRNAAPKDYPLFSNDKLLAKNLPIAGAKTGFTNMAGKCIVALFKGNNAEHMVVVLNSDHHFKAAERIYKWACKF